MTPVELEEEFAMWWETYPLKKDRKRALAVWLSFSKENCASACAKLSTALDRWHAEKRKVEDLPSATRFLYSVIDDAARYRNEPCSSQPEWPTPDQIAERKRDLAEWKIRLKEGELRPWKEHLWGQ